MEKNEHFIQVCNYFFTGKQQVPAGEQPRLIFVFGSPGAGKSTNIKPLLLKSFQTSPACLEVDELKAFLPEGEEQNPQMADEWFNRIVDEAVKLRYNLVIFRLRNMLLPGQTARILRHAREHGYQTEVDILALDRRRSTLGMIHRYEQALENQNKSAPKDVVNYPRRPEFAKHFILFKALPVVTGLCEKSKLVDKINVYDRQGNRLAWQNKISGTRSELSPSQALRQERKRRWLLCEKARYQLQRREDIEKMKRRRSAFRELWTAKILTSLFGK